MDLTKEQKENLKKLSRNFEKLEKETAQNNIDLDVFISEYNDDGFAFYVTEQIDMKQADDRKKIFRKTGKEKVEKTTASKSK